MGGNIRRIPVQCTLPNSSRFAFLCLIVYWYILLVALLQTINFIRFLVTGKTVADRPKTNDVKLFTFEVPTDAEEAVIGLDKLKKFFEAALILPVKQPQFFEGNRRPLYTALLHGPPGTGKTLIIKTVAASAGSDAGCYRIFGR